MLESGKYAGVFLVDVEATAPTPMSGVMTEFAVVHMASGSSFYARLYRSHPDPNNPAIPVAELDAAGHPVVAPHWSISDKVEPRSGAFQAGGGNHWGEAFEPGAPPRCVAVALREWLSDCDRRFGIGRRTLVSDNNGFDAMWLNCFTDSAIGELLFGHSSRRIGDFHAGRRGNWSDQTRWKSLRRTRHTHHPLDDARGNAEALRVLLGIDPSDVPAKRVGRPAHA